MSIDALRARVARVLPDDGSTAVTSRQYADSQVSNLTRRAGSVTAILVALSLLAGLVAMGVIGGTFAILVTQRTRELALLRMLGMTRRQVHSCVLAEAGLVGLGAAGIGSAAGIPAAFGLRALTALTGNGVPVSVIRIDPLNLVLVALGGAAVTLVIATAPARQAMRVGPLDGWRQLAERPGRRNPVRRRVAVIASLLAGAAAVAAGALGADNWRPAVMTTGGVAVAGGVLASLPGFSAGLVLRLAPLAGRAGASAAVAVTSARRQPRRSTAPAAALMLGVLLVTTVAVLAATAHASITDLVRRADRADLVLASDAAPGIDPETVVHIREAPAVAVAAEFGTDRFTLNSRDEYLIAVDSDTVDQVLHLPIMAGTLADFADGDIAATKAAVAGGHFHIGDFVAVRFGRPQLRYLRVSAIVADNGVTRDWVIPFETYRLGYFNATIRTVFVKAQPGTTADQLRRQVNAGIAGFPGIQVRDAAAYAQSEARRAEGPVALVQALAGLAVVVTLLGVANTLSLSVVERRHELGLLRLLGMTPGQLSLTVQWQALYIAVLGTGFGVTAGAILGLTLAAADSGHGIRHLRVPAPSLVAVCAVVVACTLMAAALPARRAARLDGLAALPTEV